MKIYKIRTNAWDAFVTVDEDNKVLCDTIAEYVLDINIRDVEEANGWDESCMGMDFDEYMEVDKYGYDDPERPMIIDVTELCIRERVNTYHFGGDSRDAYDVIEYDDGEWAIQASNKDGYVHAYYDFYDFKAAGLELPDMYTGAFYGREEAGYAACREFIKLKAME